MIVVGIDPGVTGALALFSGGKLEEIVDMPVFATRADGAELAQILERWWPDTVYLEDVHAMPKNGSVATFKLGLNTGIVIGIVQAAHIPLRRVSPQVWKRATGVSGKPKDAARGLCTELYPQHASKFRRVSDDGRADAVLIGRYGVYDQIRETNEQSSATDRAASGEAVGADVGRARHPAGRAGNDQRPDPGESGRGEGIAEVRPFVRPRRPRGGAEPGEAG